MEALVAATGVAGGAPPANVEIVYCWANATRPPPTHRLTALAAKLGAPLLKWKSLIGKQALNGTMVAGRRRGVGLAI